MKINRNDNAVQFERRRLPYVQDTSRVSYEKLRRIIDLAIPFLNLYSPAALGVAVTMGACNSAVQLKESCVAFKAHRWMECGKKLTILVCLVSSVAATILMPVVAIVTTQGCWVAAEVTRVGQSLYHREYVQVSKSLLNIASSVVYIGAAVYVTPEFLLLSLMLQGGGELIQSYHEFGKGRYLETVANIVLASIRGYGAKAHGSTVRRNWFGKKLTQEDWQRLNQKMSDVSREGFFDLEQALIKENFSSHIKEIHSEGSIFYKTVFQNLHFKSCNFDNASFNHNKLHKVSFDTCRFGNARFMHALFSKTAFKGCFLQNSIFYQSVSKELRFEGCNLIGSAFNDSFHKHLQIERCDLEGVSFLHAEVQRSQIKKSDLTNCILANCKQQFTYSQCSEHKFTKPVIALTWNFDQRMYYTSQIKEAVEREGGLVMRFEFSPEDINVELLAAEVQEKAALLKKDQAQISFSLADAIISNAKTASQMAKMQRKMDDVVKAAHGVILSGGDDVEPIFYDKEVTPEKGGDYRRSVLEMMLIKGAKEQELPLMGTCRGSQIVNVYYNGTLRDVGVQSGLSQFEYVGSASKTRFFQELLNDQTLWGVSAHHQAIDKLGVGLEVVAQAGDIPKLTVGGSKRAPILLTQFHPESYPYAEEVKKELDVLLKSIKDKTKQEAYSKWYIQDLYKEYAALAHWEKNKKFYEYFLAFAHSREGVFTA